MIYLIALIILLLIVILFILFYSPNKAPERRRAVAPVSSELPPELTAEAVDEQELTLEDITEVPEGTGSEHELELTLEEPGAVQEEELTLDVAESEAPAVEAPAAEVVEEPVAAPEEEIPFIEEGESGHLIHGEPEPPPALAGFDEDAELAHEETPLDLAERLDFFFGSDEDTGEGPVEEGGVVATEEAVPEETAAEVVEEETPTAEEIPEELPPAGLSLEEYDNRLRKLEEKLRQELDRAISEKETGKLVLLESELTAVCVRLADLPGSMAKHNMLLEDFEQLLSELSQALPGFQVETVRRHLGSGEMEVVQSLLLEAAQQVPELSPLAARVRFMCGRLAEEQASFSLAGELYQQACAGEEQEPDVLYAAGRMARILGNDEQARLWLEALLEGSAKESADSNMLNLARHELAKVYVRTEQKDKAEPLLQEALAGLEQTLGVGHPSLGPVLHDLAALYESLGQYDQATPMYKRALEVCEQGLGADHPQLANTLSKLAGLYEELEEEDQAEPLYEKALAIKKKLLGPAHPDVGILLNHLANLLKQRGEYAKAEPMFLSSLEIAETALGSDHPNLTVILNNLAELYEETGDGEKAEQYQERAFALFELPGAGGDFVEMEKDHVDVDDEKNKTIAGG